jgi:hypothetical protein
MICRRLTGLIVVLLCVFFSRVTQATDALTYEQKLQVLQDKRTAIIQRYDYSAKQCWQLFMVNDCLQAARQERRRAMEPIDRQEHAVRAEKRAQAVADRLERLDAKKPSLEMTHDSQP